MKKRDLLWLLAYPVYQTISTLRHEGSHALAAMAEGAHITEFVFWPTFHNGRFYWGYLYYEGSTTWFTVAAPYFCDLLISFVAVLVILGTRPRRRWLWANLLVIGVISPLVNSAYNYFSGLRVLNDVGELLSNLDPAAVHLYFGLTLAFYAWEMYHCYFRKKTWHPE